MTKGMLLYQVHEKSKLIQTELEKATLQQDVIRKRLNDITASIFVYIGFIIAPPLVSRLFGLMATVFFHPFTLVISSVVSVLCTVVLIFLFPYFLYSVVKYVQLSYINRKNSGRLWAPPSVRNPVECLNKPTRQILRVALEMVEWKIYRYTHFLDELKRFAVILEGEPNESVMAEIEAKTKEFPLYIDVEADLGLTKKVKVRSIAISLAIVGIALFVTVKVLLSML